MINKIGIISTFPPTQCGIATYSSDLISGLKNSYPYIEVKQFELLNDNTQVPECFKVQMRIRMILSNYPN